MEYICRYDRAMDIAHSATYDDVGFELACVMYNIGAVHAAIAVSEARENEDVSLTRLVFSN